MGSAIKIGESIPLIYQLHDGDTTKFVRATVEDPDGNPIAGSPASMPHVSNGKYENNSLLMPDKRYVSVTYQVFDDAGFTTPSPDHYDGVDSFELTVLDQDLIDLLIELRDLLDLILDAGISVVGANLVGEVTDESEFEGEISETQEITGIITEPDAAEGEVDDGDITGEISTDYDIDGNADCS